jgi:hypothetical protein
MDSRPFFLWRFRRSSLLSNFKPFSSSKFQSVFWSKSHNFNSEFVARLLPLPAMPPKMKYCLLSWSDMPPGLRPRPTLPKTLPTMMSPPQAPTIVKSPPAARNAEAVPAGVSEVNTSSSPALPAESDGLGGAAGGSEVNASPSPVPPAESDGLEGGYTSLPPAGGSEVNTSLSPATKRLAEECAAAQVAVAPKLRGLQKRLAEECATAQVAVAPKLRGLQIKERHALRFLGEFLGNDKQSLLDLLCEDADFVEGYFNKTYELKNNACKVLEPGSTCYLFASSGRNNHGVPLTRALGIIEFKGYHFIKHADMHLVQFLQCHMVTEQEYAQLRKGWAKDTGGAFAWEFRLVDRFAQPLYLPKGPQSGGWINFYEAELKKEPDLVQPWAEFFLARRTYEEQAGRCGQIPSAKKPRR